MPDKEKVIEWADKCISTAHESEDCNECPYHLEHEGFYSCIECLLMDTVALLKEQEATQKDGYNLQELWKRARTGETLNETELNFLLADWDERNIFKQQEM